MQGYSNRGGNTSVHPAVLTWKRRIKERAKNHENEKKLWATKQTDVSPRDHTLSRLWESFTAGGDDL
jgi:hypothetical protein